MIDRLKVRVSSTSIFWKALTLKGKFFSFLERSKYRNTNLIFNSKTNVRTLGSIAWIGVKSLFWIILILAALNFVEFYFRSKLSWPSELSDHDKLFNIEQLRLYAQLLTAIFSIYFATIGIILSAGYTQLRRDIIGMLTNEQVGSVYSRVLVFAAIFCLSATAMPLFGFEPGLFVYLVGTFGAILSVLALFPLGQRLFNFFDLNLLVRSDILPRMIRNIEGATNRKNSISLANHHLEQAQLAFQQLSYIDDRVKAKKDGLKSSLPALTDDYTALLRYYLQRKHMIDQNSYWFPRRRVHKQWFLAGDMITSRALKMSSQHDLVEEKLDYQWLENEIVDRLIDHVELAFQVGDSKLALRLIDRFSGRISVYSAEFQLDVGMRELERLKDIILQSFISSSKVRDADTVKIGIAIADKWAALGSNLCLETLLRIMSFEEELNQFFEADEWSEESLTHLPAILQVEFAFIIEHITFEQEVEGLRLSKPKYVQQLVIQKLLQHYAKILPIICNFYQVVVPEFVSFMVKQKMSEAATQVVLSSLHNHWKLPSWFGRLAQLIDRYQSYEHYRERYYRLPDINIVEMSQQLVSGREHAINLLASGDMVRHIFDSQYTNELPDHFGQIYFELAEACISALENNDESKLEKILPMFMSLTFVARDSRFTDPELEVNDEFRLHLISTVINDLASVLGYSILYGEYFNNKKLSEHTIAEFDNWVEKLPDKQQYFKSMLLLSNPHSFSMSASPRSLIRTNWKMSFEQRASSDGYGDRMSLRRGKIHPNKVVREFLRSYSEASHLFFAKQILPKIEIIDFKVDNQITALARRLSEEEGGV